MASMDGLVPITRAFLASYYDKYPFTPLSDDVSRLTTEIRSVASDLCKDFPPTEGESLLIDEADCQPPHKIDENMWKNREQIEEILFLLESSHWPEAFQQQSTSEDAELASLFGRLRDKFQNTLKVLEFFQSRNAEYVFNTVMTYMPQDFRGTLIRQQRERSERNKQAEVDALVSAGGSIRDRYAMLWNQQMERRRQLAQLGSATGVYKTLVKYLVGVPEADGRAKAPLWTTFVQPYDNGSHYSIDFFFPYHSGDLKIESCEISCNPIFEVFTNSPFFITAEVSGALEGRKNDDYKELTIPAGKTYEVSLSVESINSYIAWDFALPQSKMNLDIGFSVEYTDSLGKTTLILPYRRYESDQGNFCTIMAGNYKLIWDNSYSTFFRKVLRYKVDCIPPVVDPVNSAATEAEEG
ncbi:hypothetical protein TEA_029611 [Camellia sinensis var. sinensis]|uniref:GOLD domain-containing protein n=1 Tax=Camellia sinensis var. sinensis TaxID=542762 RepID=A0A4S4DP11_CAMSN|nr:hypothetical protein TEA_029611 [Camellia sinensis var. sinensis]